MLGLLNWRIWLLVGLLALGPIGYLKGRGDGKELVRAEWLSAKAQADSDARSLEQRRQRRADEAANLTAAARRDDRDRAASADRRIAGMRGTLDATERNAAQSLAAATATVSAYRAVFESCVAEYRAMGAEAAGHATDSLNYQQAWPQ